MACNNCCCLEKLPVYKLCTNGFIDNGTNALFGIDPRVWRSLPCEGLALLKVRQAIPATANGLVVAIAVPTDSTVTTVGDSVSTVSSIPVTNVAGETYTGQEFPTNTERLVYFNKGQGVIRTLDCCTNPTMAA